MTRSVMAEVDLGVFARNYPPEQRTELNEQTARACGLWDRLQQADIPGVILGDEVGKGKTYIALALHRQVPYGVMGAYRILANLLALGR